MYSSTLLTSLQSLTVEDKLNILLALCNSEPETSPLKTLITQLEALEKEL